MPNASGFPGFTATPQKTSSTPSSASTRRTRSCGPTETPPELTRTSASSPRSSASPVRLRIVRDRPEPLDQRAGGRERRREHRAVRLVDLPRPERLARRAQLGARAQHGDPAAAARTTTSAIPAAASAPTCAAPSRVPAGEQRLARAHVAADRPDVRSRSTGSGDLDAVVLFDNELDRHDGVGARRERCRRSRSPSPRRPRAAARRAGPPRSGRRPAASPGASAARTANPSIAELAKRRQVDRARASSASTRPAASATGTRSDASGRARASTARERFLDRAAAAAIGHIR